jgi:hypothetical protein
MSLETKLSFRFRDALGECLAIHVPVKTVYAVHSQAHEVTTLLYFWDFTHTNTHTHTHTHTQSVQSSSTE